MVTAVAGHLNHEPAAIADISQYDLRRRPLA